MTDETPIACTLGAGELERRLAAIADAGASLTSHGIAGDEHVLHFRADPKTRRQLDEIVAAEAECCAFLDLSLTEVGDDLILSIAAPKHGKAAADGLAAAFQSAAKCKTC